MNKPNGSDAGKRSAPPAGSAIINETRWNHILYSLKVSTSMLSHAIWELRETCREANEINKGCVDITDFGHDAEMQLKQLCNRASKLTLYIKQQNAPGQQRLAETKEGQ